MVTINMESVFPASRDRLWKLLPLHVDSELIRKIHPRILSQQLVRNEGNIWTVERRVRLLGRTFNLTMKVTMSPMDLYRGEIIASSGGVAPGSYVENRYSEGGEGTIVSTKGEFRLRGVPGFLQGWIVDRSLNQADDEDLQYLRKMEAKQ